MRETKQNIKRRRQRKTKAAPECLENKTASPFHTPGGSAPLSLSESECGTVVLGISRKLSPWRLKQKERSRLHFQEDEEGRRKGGERSQVGL